MDRQQILDEGLLTSFLLGTLGEEQHNEVSRILEKDRELQQQYELLEADFERLALENAIAPPTSVLSGLKKQLESESDSPVIPLSTSNKNFTLLRSRLMIAASLAALFALATFWFYSQWQDTLGELEELQIQTADLQNQMNSLEGNLASTTQQFQRLTDPNVMPMV
ncbi:MAG: hypothetical protein KJO90_04295, partial [Eudoraea sp.]|nr:hypothetical protein [Eudoraea sp.]